MRNCFPSRALCQPSASALRARVRNFRRETSKLLSSGRDRSYNDDIIRGAEGGAGRNFPELSRGSKRSDEEEQKKRVVVLS